MNTQKINPKIYFFNYPLKINTNLNEVRENLASTIPGQKADSPGNFWNKNINPTDQFIILGWAIFLVSLLFFVTFSLLFLIIYLN